MSMQRRALTTRQNSSLFGSGKLTAEFTQGQLVIGSCAMLFIVLLCFVVGMIIGRSQAHKDSELLQAAKTGGAAQTAPEIKPGSPEIQEKKPSTAPPRDQGVQTSPRTGLLDRPALPQTAKAETAPVTTPAAPATGETAKPPQPAQTPAVTPVPAAAASAPGAPAASTTVRPISDKTVLPPLPPIPKTASEIQRSMQTAHAPAAQPTTPPVPIVPSPAATPPSPAGKPGEGAAVAVSGTAKPIAKPAAAETAPASKTGAAPAGKYGIQVAAFQGAEKEKAAAECQRRLKANAGFESIVLTTKDGVSCQVVIPGYKDRPSAQKSLSELKKKPGFSDAWIKEIK